MKDMREMLKMLSQKGDSKMSEQEIQAKLEVLQELMDLASSKAGEGIAGHLKQVMVAAPDKKGLMEGLEKAQEVTDEMPEHSDEENPEEDKMESPTDEEEEDEEGY